MSRMPPMTVRQRVRAAWVGRLALLMLIGTLLPPADAQPAPEPLGRLFFTPERRQALDRQRQLNIEDKPVVVDDPTLTINGVVTRSSGRDTVWINGVAQTPDGVVTPKRANPGQLLVQPQGSAALPAKVGETINRNTGETADPLNGGRISRRSSRAP